MSFAKMKKPELLKMATEDFAVEVPEGATVPQILGLLTENGVTWSMAVQNSEIAAKYAVQEAAEQEADHVAKQGTAHVAEAVAPLEREQEPVRPGATVTTSSIKGTTDVVSGVGVPAETPVVVTAPKAVLPEKVLLRMDRENGSYQIRGYKFTKQHPYALVSAADAEYIVENVEGFYYATPKEAQEFYG